MIDVNIILDIYNMALQWAATLLLFLIVKKFVYKPVKELLEKRQAVVMKDITDARKDAEEAKELKLNYEEKLKEAKMEGNRIIEESRKRGKEVQIQLVDEGKEKANKTMEKARFQIEIEKQQAFNEVKSATSNMAVLIAEKIIGKNLDEKNDEVLIEKFIEELGTKNV